MACKGQRRDPAWKYGVEHEVPGSGPKKGYKYIKCKFCGQVVKGGVIRMKAHLAWTNQNAKPCPDVPLEVKDEISQYLKDFTEKKHTAQRNFEEMVDNGAYFGNKRVVGGGNGSSSTNSSINQRSVRGPMDRFVETPNEDGEGPEEKMTQTTAKEQRNKVCLDIGRFFYENGIPFNVATSPSFASMLRSVGNYGRGLKAPSMYELRTWILKEEFKTTTTIVDDIKATWSSTGVSILSDGWSDMRNRSLINFLVNNPYGTVFLKTVDASNCIKNAQKLFELLDGVVEEVGEDIVVQVVTDNASAYKAAGTLLMEKRKSLYWTPCAAHCIDLMLEKIGDLTQHKNALIKAKKVSNYIYNHQWVLSLARKYLKKDLLRPAATRFATAFLTIQSMHEVKAQLQQMFVSNEWMSCAWAKKSDGKDVKKIVMDDRSFWPSVVYSLKTTMPLVSVLRLVDGEAPAMAFIYGAMDECKEKIAQNFNNDVSSYKEIWDIIDQKWEKQLHRDLHAAGYYLNPQYRWSPNVSEHPEIKRGLYDCMEKLVKDDNVYMKIESQLDDYKYKKGLLGYKGSMNSYQTKPPVIWWGAYGDEVPELRDFASKVLGLTCSASACERNWSTFNQVHTKRRNRLNTERMHDLVYIMYNKKLKQKFNKKANLKEGHDPLLADEVLSDDEWIAEPNNIQVGGTEIGTEAAGTDSGTDSVTEVAGTEVGGTEIGTEADGTDSVTEVAGTEVGGSTREKGQSSSRKRKHVLTLIDEDDDSEVDPDDEDDMEVEEDAAGMGDDGFYNI